MYHSLGFDRKSVSERTEGGGQGKPKVDTCRLRGEGGQNVSKLPGQPLWMARITAVIIKITSEGNSACVMQ